MVLVDLDRTDQAAGQFGFVGDGTNDVARFHAVLVADLDPVATHGLVTAAFVAPVTRVAVFTTATHMGGFATARLFHHFRFFQDQRLTLEHHGSQSGGHVVVADVHGVTQLVNQRASFINIGSRGESGQLLLEAGNALGIQVIHRWQRHLFDALAGNALDLTQHVLLTASHEQDGVTLAAGTAGTTNTVHVGFRIAGHVVVHHVGDPGHVQTASDHVGGNQQVKTLVFQTLYGFFPLLLGNIAVQGFGTQAATVQLLSQFQSGLLGAHENQHGIVFFGFQNPAHGVQLVQPGHRPVTLADGGAGGGAAIVDANQFGLLEVLIGNLANDRRHGGGEQRQLTVIGGTFEYPFHIVDEAHAEHFIGFIQHQGFQIIQFHGAAFHVIHDATGGADNHLGATAQAFQLGAVFSAAVNGQNLQPFDVFGKFFTCSGDLDSQLAGWGQNQHLRFTQSRIQAGQKGQCKRSRFTCAGLCLAQKIVSIQQQRDGLRLNRRRLLEALTGDRSEQNLGQA